MKTPTARLALAVMLAPGWVLVTGATRAAVIGAQLGVNNCGIYGDAPPNSEYTGKTGLIAGVQAEIGLARDISLSVQPSYVQKINGWTTALRSGSEADTKLTLDYVAVPVVVKFSAASGHAYCASGVTVDFLTSARLSGQGFDKDVTSSFRSVDVGALLGLGFVIPVGRPCLTTELRYVQGLARTAGGTTQETVGGLPPRVHSFGWELITGVVLPLRRP